MDANSITVQLEIALSAVEDCRRAVLAYLAPFRLAEKARNRIEVILEELITNVVRHSNGATSLTVAITCGTSDVRLVVEDDGPEFDPLQVAPPQAFNSLEEVPLGGLGIPLIRKLSRSVAYERIESAIAGTNRVRVEVAR